VSLFQNLLKLQTSKSQEVEIFFLFFLFLGNFPKPKILDHGDNLECVSMYVSNSNNVSWTKNNFL